MKYSALIFLLILSSMQVVIAGNRLIIGDSESYDFSCEAILEKDTVKFVFIDEVNQYKTPITWNNNPNSAIEYAWFVFFDEEYTHDGVVYEGYDIGVRYFTRDDAPSKGALIELFSISDISGFAYRKNHFIPIYINKSDLTVNIVGSNVELVLRLASSTSFFFNSKPEKANFWVLGNNKRPRKCLTKIVRKGKLVN
ncbi:MAG: hypothetical protein L3J24_14700 [Xanthomonadales bacterium]|nr:hypothetical protein [Xanthomonadales bacterium]